MEEIRDGDEPSSRRTTVEVLQRATEELQGIAEPQMSGAARDLDIPSASKPVKNFQAKVKSGESWGHVDADEFFADYQRHDLVSAYYSLSWGVMGQIRYALAVGFDPRESSVRVHAETRAEIERVFNIFEHNAISSRLPEPPPPLRSPWEDTVRIFIGHGHAPDWKEVRDHLRDLHGFRVEAYESGARAGMTVQRVLAEILTASSFAILVLTGENEDRTGRLHARENVIHEAGLFQGRLGFERAILLVEEGVPEFSNEAGINTLHFPKSGIRQVFGDVLATIRREFHPDQPSAR